MKRSFEQTLELENSINCFWSTGTGGASVLSLEYATQLAKLRRKTLLIDFDLVDPSLMIYLAVDDYPSGLQAGLRLATQSRLDATNLNQLIVQSEDHRHLHLMAGMPVQGRFNSIETGSITSLLVQLANWYDEIVLDLGSLYSQTTNSKLFELQSEAIDASENAYGIFRADPEGIAKLFLKKAETSLIANIYRAGSLGAGGRKALKTVVQENTGQPLLEIIGEDDNLTAAIAKGISVGEVNRKSPISIAVKNLIQSRVDSTH